MKKKKKVVKRKIKWKTIFKLFLFLVFLSGLYLGIKQIPTRHIVVKGNTILSDFDLISLANYQEYPPLFSKSNSEIKQNMLQNPYLNSVKIRRSLLGQLTLEVDEAKPLFYNRERKKLVLSNQKEIETDALNGVPILTNYVPDVLYERLIHSMENISNDIIGLISEIIYEPWKNGDVIIDDTRFFLRMNDGNHVYVNLIHFEKLNNYIEIYATLEGKKGILYLDSSSDKISFSLFK